MKAANIHFVFIECLQRFVLRCTYSMQVLLLKNGLTDEDAYVCVCLWTCQRKGFEYSENLSFFFICIF